MKDVFDRDPFGSRGSESHGPDPHAMPLSRRRALGALCVMGALGLGLLVAPQWRRVVSPGRVVDVGALARAMMPLSRDERATLGQLIRTRDSSRDYTREVAAALGGRVRVRGTDLVGPRDLGVVVEALSQRSREDFAKGRVEMIDRWYLSRTQCDVLALAVGANARAARTTAPAARAVSATTRAPEIGALS